MQFILTALSQMFGLVAAVGQIYKTLGSGFFGSLETLKTGNVTVTSPAKSPNPSSQVGSVGVRDATLHPQTLHAESARIC